MAARCVVNGNARVKSGDLYSAFKSWAVMNGEWEMSEREFSQALSDRGFEKYKSGSVRGWKGLGLLEEKADDALPF